MIVRIIVCLTLLFFVLWVLAGVAVKAQTVTLPGVGSADCFTVRRLTTIERWYWVKRLGLSQEQINQIRKVCRKK